MDGRPEHLPREGRMIGSVLRQPSATVLGSVQRLRRDATLRKLLANSGWLLSADTIARILTFLQGVVVARALGATQFGILALITTFTLSMTQLLDSRVWETAIRFIIEYRERGDSRRATAVVKFCYLIDGAAGILTFGLILLTAGVAARLFLKDPGSAHLLQLNALSVLVAIPLGTSSALVRVAERFDWLAYHGAGVAALRLAGAVAVLMVGAGLEGLIVVYILAAAVGVLWLFLLGRRATRTLELPGWKQAPLSLLRGEYGRLFRFLLSTNGSALLKMFQRNADVLLIGFWLTPAAAGFFRLARSITDLMAFPIGPAYTTAYPEFSRLWAQGNAAGLRRLARTLTLGAVGIALAGVTAVWFGGEWIIRLSVGTEYLPAVPVMQWLALGVALAIATNFGHPLLLAMGRASSSMLAIAAGVAVQMVVLVFLLPRVGVIAAGIGYLAFYVAWTAVVALTLEKTWKNRFA